MIAFVPVRAGELPAGAEEAARASGGRCLLGGEGSERAASFLGARLETGELLAVELGPYAPARWAAQLAPLLEGADVVVLPGTPDGRDLAPRLAAVLARPLLAGAVTVSPEGATVVRRGGSQLVTLCCHPPFVATLQPLRSAGGGESERGGEALSWELLPAGEAPGALPDATSEGLLEPDPAAIDLSEAARIVAGGGGLTSPHHFELLAEVAFLLGASVGATRVVTDAGHLPHERQVGTTGVAVRPRLYLAFGISGAAQHVAALGEPEHVVSVNLDESCPMMALADLALVSDAPETLLALRRALRAEAAGG